MTDPHIVYHQLNGFNEARAILLPLITMVIETKGSLTANRTQPRTEAILRCILHVDTELHREGNEF
jgi:alanine racemase